MVFFVIKFISSIILSKVNKFNFFWKIINFNNVLLIDKGNVIKIIIGYKKLLYSNINIV